MGVPKGLQKAGSGGEGDESVDNSSHGNDSGEDDDGVGNGGGVGDNEGVEKTKVDVSQLSSEELKALIFRTIMKQKLEDIPWLRNGQRGPCDSYDEFSEDLGYEEEVSGMTVAQQLCEAIPFPGVNMKHKRIAPSRGMHDCYNGGTLDTLFTAADERVGVPWRLRAAGSGGGDKNAKSSGSGSGRRDQRGESTQEGCHILVRSSIHDVDQRKIRRFRPRAAAHQAVYQKRQLVSGNYEQDRSNNILAPDR